MEIDSKWWQPETELTVPTLSFADCTVRMYTVKKAKFSIPWAKYSLLWKDRDHKPIYILEMPWRRRNICREMVSGKLFLIYMWNSGNSDTKLE